MFDSDDDEEDHYEKVKYRTGKILIAFILIAAAIIMWALGLFDIHGQ